MIPFIEFIPIHELELILGLILTIMLGFLVGLDRELHRKPAGLRTHILVCVGAFLFTVASTSFAVESSRIAAGIVTGIGFLGAGAIFRSKDHVEGLTTAADLWVLAAVGLLVGIGYYFSAFFSTIVLLGVLFMGRKLKKQLKIVPRE